MAAYQPATNLYASLQWRAPGIPRNVMADSEGFFAPRRRFILLLHGYNVSEKGGQKALHGFERRLRRYSASLGGDLGWLMWPGDLKVPLIGGAAYPFKVTAASKIGERIARFLEKLRNHNGDPSEIVVVAHSLGCRVTLEALRTLLERGAPANISIMLMAAAVPVSEIQQGGRLRAAALYALRRAVMHSKHDWVLQTLFRAGQSLTPGEKFWPQAVGTAGQPGEVWGESFLMQGFGHSSYWSSAETAKIFAQWMGRSSPRATQRRVLAIRAAAHPRQLPLRTLSARRISQKAE